MSGIGLSLCMVHNKNALLDSSPRLVEDLRLKVRSNFIMGNRSGWRLRADHSDRYNIRYNYYRLT